MPLKNKGYLPKQKGSSHKKFEAYYLAYATKTLHDIKQEYSFDPYVLKVFNSLFEQH